MKNLILIFLTTILLTGCSGMKIEDFNDTKPEFIPQEYFNGKLRAYGLVKNRSGEIIRSFKGEMIGSWDKYGNGKLEEVKNLGFDEYFIRMWKMYLNYCEAAFLTRNINLHQLVFTRDQNIDLNKGLIA